MALQSELDSMAVWTTLQEREGQIQRIYNLFDDKKSADKGIYTFKFGREDIMRNDILAYIIEKFEELH